MNRIVATLFAATLAVPAFAAGDAANGEKVFKKCKSCHSVVSDSGDVIFKGGKSGPNLWNVSNRQQGSLPGFKYGKDLVALGKAAGGTWTEAEFVEWVADPRKYLRAKLDDSKAKSKMSFKLKNSGDAADVWAYLVSVGSGS